MRSLAVRRALARRASALERDLPAALEGDVESLHHARVASRRLREILPVLPLGDGPDERAVLAQIRGRLRRLTRALGGVRELDVALVILDSLRPDNQDLADALTAARSTVEDERRLRWDAMNRQLDDIEAFRLADDLAWLDGHLGDTPEAGRARLVRRRLVRRADRLDAAVESAGALYLFDRLHLVRIAVKQLRYVLELVHELQHIPSLRLVNQLKRTQDLLGQLHDLDVVAGYIRRQGGEGRGRFASEVRRAEQLVYRRTRELHASYLAGARALGEVIAACRGPIDRKLAAAPPARRPHSGDSHGR